MQNLICDCNYLLMKAVFTLHKMNRLYGDLWNFLDQNINKYKLLNKWEHIYLVSDSKKKSWRQLELDSYKGHRTKQEDIDWEWVFATYTEWKESMSETCTVLQRDHIEGDDWITSLILKLNKKGKSCVTISSDQDLLQLIDYKINKNKSWINIQIVDTLGKEHIYLPEGWNLWLKEYEENTGNDLFCLDDSLDNINFFKNILNKWEYEEVNKYEKLFTKIVQGDKSDNINSIYQKLTKTGKTQNIGKAGAQKIWEFYKENYNIFFDTDSDEFKNDLINCLEQTNNIILSEGVKKNVSKNIDTNIKLIELHYKHYPEWVLDEIVNELNEKLNV